MQTRALGRGEHKKGGFMKHHFKVIRVILCVFLFSPFINTAFAQNPGKTWQKYKTPEQAGWSWDQLKEICHHHNMAALMIIYNGKVAAAIGDIARRYKCHSVRKSFLSALYGIHTDNGDIDLQKTLKDLNIDDIIPLTEKEKEARIIDLLKARSGIFIPASAETREQQDNRPKRGSHKPDTSWFYNNWDFNVLGTIFEKETKTDIFVDFYNRIAVPLHMEDFRIMDGTHDYYDRETSIHPSYPFKMSARDMARFGQLYLQKGKWNGKQIISQKWIEDSSTSFSKVTGEGPEYDGYGYLWWINSNFNGTNMKMYFASGVGGQYIAVFPSENIVIVMRGNTYAGEFIRSRYDAVKKIFKARIGKPVKNPGFIPLHPLHSSPSSQIKTIKLTPQQRKKYTGQYRGEYIDLFNSRYHKGNDHAFFIMEKKGELTLERYDYFYSFRLLPISPKKFFIEDIELFLIFQLDDQGAPVHPVFHKSEETAELYYTIINKGIAAGIRQFRELKDNIDDSFDLKFLANNLRSIDKQNEALEVLRLNVLRFPESVICHREYKNNFSKYNDIKDLSHQYDQMLDRLKTGKGSYKVFQWYTQLYKARAFPVSLSNKELNRYTGKYGPRRIVIKKGDLYYYRDDWSTPREFKLLKLSGNVFVLDDDYLDGFRLGFEIDKNNRTSGIIGLYIDGSRDEFKRDSSGR